MIALEQKKYRTKIFVIIQIVIFDSIEKYTHTINQNKFDWFNEKTLLLNPLKS